MRVYRVRRSLRARMPWLAAAYSKKTPAKWRGITRARDAKGRPYADLCLRDPSQSARHPEPFVLRSSVSKSSSRSPSDTSDLNPRERPGAQNQEARGEGRQHPEIHDDPELREADQGAA